MNVLKANFFTFCMYNPALTFRRIYPSPKRIWERKGRRQQREKQAPVCRGISPKRWNPSANWSLFICPRPAWILSNRRDGPPSPRHRHIGCRFPYPSMCGQSDHRGKGMAHTIAESLHCPRTDLLYFGEVLDLVRFNHCLQIFKYHGQKDFVDQCQLFTCLPIA